MLNCITFLCALCPNPRRPRDVRFVLRSSAPRARLVECQSAAYDSDVCPLPRPSPSCPPAAAAAPPLPLPPNRVADLWTAARRSVRGCGGPERSTRACSRLPPLSSSVLLLSSSSPGVAARGAPGWPLLVRKIGACAGCTRGWATDVPLGLVGRSVQGAAASPRCQCWLAPSTRLGRVDSLFHCLVSQLPLGCNSSPCQSHFAGMLLHAACSILGPLSWEGLETLVARLAVPGPPSRPPSSCPPPGLRSWSARPPSKRR